MLRALLPGSEGVVLAFHGVQGEDGTGGRCQATNPAGLYLFSGATIEAPVSEPRDPFAPIHEGLFQEKFRRELERAMRGVDGPRSGTATWLGGDRFELRGTFTLLELTCVYVAARECYPSGTIEGRRVRGALPPWW